SRLNTIWLRAKMPSGPEIGSPVACFAVLPRLQILSSCKLSGGSKTRSKPMISVEISRRSKLADARSSTVQPLLKGVSVPLVGSIFPDAQYSPSTLSNCVLMVGTGFFLSMKFQWFRSLLGSKGFFGSFSKMIAPHFCLASLLATHGIGSIQP